MQKKNSLNNFFTGIKNEGEDQFVGHSKGGVLTDPKAQNQSIRFAIVKNEKLSKNEFFNHTSEEFEDFFKNSNKSPSIIDTNPEKGSDLVLYYSAEIFNENQINKKTGRTV